MEEKRTPPEFHRLQERFLLDVLRRSSVPMERVLEIGCGFGRITKRLAETWPGAKITALDLSPEQLANARGHCQGLAGARFEQYDFYSDQPFPGHTYDTVIAIEVFLHHPPEVVVRLFRKLAGIARYLVNIDWSEQWPWPRPEHVWVHDYARLYAEGELACATFLLPEKVDGKQQKLFIAGRELSPAVAELERQVEELSLRGAGSTPSESDWAQEVRLATTEILGLIPEGSSFILVDDDQWGTGRAFAGRRVIPFLEQGGSYWGPPADDATAWAELERLRRAGAGHLIFAWPSFWWLEHYAEFHRRLGAQFPRVLANERLVAFKLAR